MRRIATLILVLLVAITSTGCAFMGLLGRGNAEALRYMVEANTANTDSAFLAMTALGMAYNMGAFGPPGSAQAEATWAQISTESIRLNHAFNEWSACIKNGTDPAVYVAKVKEHMAVLKNILTPAAKRVSLAVPTEMPNLDPVEALARLGRPESFRLHEAVYGGAR